MEQQQKAGLSGFQGLGAVVVTGNVSVFCSFWVLAGSVQGFLLPTRVFNPFF